MALALGGSAVLNKCAGFLGFNCFLVARCEFFYFTVKCNAILLTNEGCFEMMQVDEMKALRSSYRQSGQTVVFTNGCFDILHAGHVRYLIEAKKLGDVLVVGLNSDKSVRVLKGEGRPVNTADDRAEVLAGLRAVDHVVVFGETTAEELVRQIQPDIYVKGGDYSLDRLPEAALVAAGGGQTMLVPLVEGRSTTNVIKKLQSAMAAEAKVGKDKS